MNDCLNCLIKISFHIAYSCGSTSNNKKSDILLIHTHDKPKIGVGKNTEQMLIIFSDTLKICNISWKCASVYFSCGEIFKRNKTQKNYFDNRALLFGGQLEQCSKLNLKHYITEVWFFWEYMLMFKVLLSGFHCSHQNLMRKLPHKFPKLLMSSNVIWWHMKEESKYLHCYHFQEDRSVLIFTLECKY